LPTVYDVIVISPPGALQANFHDGFSKSDHDFLIAFHSNFLTGMHGFGDNEVLLPTGNDVIVISPLGGVSQVLLTESERATLVSYSWFIDIFRVSLTVSELINILWRWQVAELY